MATARLGLTALDCADPSVLADFWAALLGGEVAHRNDEFHAVKAEGGLLVAVTEMALAGDTGVELTVPETSHAFWFGEEQARYVLCVKDAQDAAALLAAAGQAGIPAAKIGHAAGNGKLTHSDTIAISLPHLREAHERFFPAWFAL